MPDGHGWCRPEGEQETEIDRVANEFIEQGRLEARMLCHSSVPMLVNLLKAEQVEMVDQEGADQHDRPPEPEDRPKNCRSRRVAHRPDHARHWTPLPKQQNQNE